MLFDKASALLLANTNLLQPSRYVTSNFQISIDHISRFDWEKTTATESLVYHDCYAGFQCARLQVPLDWTAEEGADNRTVQIALIKFPAPVPVTDSRYGGAVVLNPGGPGGSGVGLGTHTQTIISAGPDTDDKTEKYFDVISFDPRGVNNTTPNFRCFPDALERMAFEKEHASYGLPGSSDTAFINLWTSQRTLADLCSKRAIKAGIGEHMSTTSVARDIVEIFERHGEWREQEARRLLTSSGNSESDLPDHLKYQPGKEMVQYWGFSYGTVLGATLADMYPDRVKRAILDGVVDSFDYYKGTWISVVQDTDKEIAKFAEYCSKGGPKNCALYHKDGPASIAQRFSAITENLLHNPIGVPGTNAYSPDLATYSDLKRLFAGVAYGPLRRFHGLAQIMAELENGNGTALVQGRRAWTTEFVEISSNKDLRERCQRTGPYSRACNPLAGLTMDQQMVQMAVVCSDSEPKTNWHARPKWPYTGHLNATTAHPILFIGNTVDNVTPIGNAYRMSKGFSGSVVLRQDTEGHASSSGVSLCTARAVRTYFQTGELPEIDTTCLPDRLPLDGYSEEKEHPLPKGETDEALWKAVVGVNDPSARMRMFW
ncbi:unnamed protein product [Aureobasidium vineae]|uniref:Peptidase S33 tripeptidyl aminopeptidase-like C-terminal domain-containing protein n=1 Tax=Aureobasidium vineae TaxID=2773715 RepID=A0A9N8J8Y8_9PEZI|nr:unnamed protein product [Aureobasidium vineae]